MNTPNHIIIDGDAISIRSSEAHEYLVTTKEVARGYGVTSAAIRKQLMRHADELLGAGLPSKTPASQIVTPVNARATRPSPSGPSAASAEA